MEPKNFIQIIKSRRSVRKYKSQPIDKFILEDIIDCARLAPTARNVQPWKFVVVTNKDSLKKLAEITKGFGDFIKDAAACIVVFCKDTKYYLEDGSAATTTILLAAQSYGIGSCWVAGDKKPYAEEIQKFLKVPEEYKLISLVSLGYPDEKPSLKKLSLKDVLHWESM